MKKYFAILLVVASSCAVAQDAKPNLSFQAPPVRGGCTAIPDFAFDGTIASMACVTVPGPGGIITDLQANLAVDHTWVGDLTVRVVAPDNTQLDIAHRPGEPVSSAFGDSSDLIATSILNFADGNPTSAEDMGSTIGGAQFVCQDDGLCNYFPFPDNANGGVGTNFATDFVGMESAGNWQICVGDSADGDTGQVCPGTDLIFGVIPPAPPEPVVIPTNTNLGLLAMIASLLFAGLFLVRRNA